MVETKVVVKEGYEEIYQLAVAKLENLETEAKAKVEALIHEDKTALEEIIAKSTKTVEIEVPDAVEDEAVAQEPVTDDNQG